MNDPSPEVVEVDPPHALLPGWEGRPELSGLLVPVHGLDADPLLVRLAVGRVRVYVHPRQRLRLALGQTCEQCLMMFGMESS